MSDHALIVTLCCSLSLSCWANVFAYRKFWQVAHELEAMRAAQLQLLARHTEGPR